MKKLDTYLSLCAEVYDLSKPFPPEDAYKFYRSYVSHTNGAILEPMCGTGRFMLPLIEEGFNVSGFDASEHMLNALKAKARIKKLQPNVWQSFVQDLSTTEQYDLIFIPSGSFGLLINESVTTSALHIFYNVLSDNGILLFEAETLKAIPKQFGVPHSSVYKRIDGDMIIATFFDLPLENNVLTSVCRYELIQNNQATKTEIEEFKIKLYEPEQLTSLLKYAGFSDIKLRKAFNRSKSPDLKDEVIIYECRK